MIDQQQLPERSCRQCGQPLSPNDPDEQELCTKCRGLEAGSGLILEHLGPHTVLETTAGQEAAQSGVHEVALPQSGSERDIYAGDGAGMLFGDGGAIIRHSTEDSGHIDALRIVPPTEWIDAGGDAGAPTGAPPDDPDHPPWGVSGGIGVWLFSVLAIIVVPTIAVIGWLFYESEIHPTMSMSSNAMRNLLTSPSAMLVNVLSLFGAHVITLAIAWVVVTRFGRYPFFSTLGFRWTAGPFFSSFGLAIAIVFVILALGSALSLVLAHSNIVALLAYLVILALIWSLVTRFGRYPFFSTLSHWASTPGFSKFCFVIAVVFAMLVVEMVLSRVLPQSRETEFEKLLKTSQQVRVAVAVLAVLTAPLVEEVVYRGVLFSALISRAGLKWTVIIVTALFALVHFPQYWGAWSGLAGITVLSFTLTIVRAKMKSIFPCIAIHFLFNIVGAVTIVTAKS